MFSRYVLGRIKNRISQVKRSIQSRRKKPNFQKFDHVTSNLENGRQLASLSVKSQMPKRTFSSSSMNDDTRIVPLRPTNQKIKESVVRKLSFEIENDELKIYNAMFNLEKPSNDLRVIIKPREFRLKPRQERYIKGKQTIEFILAEKLLEVVDVDIGRAEATKLGFLSSASFSTSTPVITISQDGSSSLYHCQGATLDNLSKTKLLAGSRIYVIRRTKRASHIEHASRICKDIMNCSVGEKRGSVRDIALIDINTDVSLSLLLNVEKKILLIYNASLEHGAKDKVSKSI